MTTTQQESCTIIPLTDGAGGPLVGDPGAITVDLFHRLGEQDWLQVRCYARPALIEDDYSDVMVEIAAVSYHWSTESGVPVLVWSNLDTGGLADMLLPLGRRPQDPRHEAQGFPLAVLATCPIADDWTPVEVRHVWLAAVQWDTALNNMSIEFSDTNPWFDLTEQ